MVKTLHLCDVLRSLKRCGTSPDSPRRAGWRRREGTWRIYWQPWFVFLLRGSSLSTLSRLTLPAGRQHKHWDTPSGKTSLLYLFPLTEAASWLAVSSIPPPPLHLLLSFIVVFCPALLHPFIVPCLLSLFPLFRQMGLEMLEGRKTVLEEQFTKKN